MNPSEEDLSMLLKILKPKYYIPTKGSFRYLVANAKLADNYSPQLNNKTIFILDNGNVLYINEEGAKIMPANMNVPAAAFLIDGKGVDSLSVNSTLLSDRQKLGEDGIIAYSFTINQELSKLVTDLDFIYHGFKIPREEERVIETFRELILDTVKRYSNLQ